MKILFIRHGEPDYQQDCLTMLGRKQAEAAAYRLSEQQIDHVFSSPMKRVLETATIIADKVHLQLNTLSFMPELNWGAMEGYTLPVEGQPWKLAKMMLKQGLNLTDSSWLEHPYFQKNIVTDKVIETSRQFDCWLSSFGYSRNKQFYHKEESGNEETVIAIVSHHGSSSAVISHLLNLSFPYFCAIFPLSFTGITTIDFQEYDNEITIPVLELYNDSNHMRGLMSE